jgi:SpoVK/Ycf46/Vps4 family AAA+-type ATPase
MLANGVATKLNRKILLINFPTLGGNSAGRIIKLIFREAKIHNAIIFFDECESLFQSREKGSSNVNMLLTEIERHDGLSILATNRASDLDEAMYRRISLAIEFCKPDHILREKIWQTLQPAKLKIAEDVDLMQLALKYELTGGFIKNSWLSAVAFAVARDNKDPVICHDDLMKAASHQLRGRLAMVDFDRRIVPTLGLDKVILPNEVKSSLQDIVNFGKAQSILFGQWGFSSQHGGSKGVGVFFHGHPGTGKTMAAEAIGYDLGRPLKVVNCAMLLSKWVGESAKNIQGVFDEAKAVDAVLVFDEAESLFGSRSTDGSSGAGRHDTANVGILLHHIETFPGVVIVITNLKDRIDGAFFRRFKFVIDFPKPSATERLRMWDQLIPPETPVDKSVDRSVLANRFDFCGGNIKSAVFRAASRAALRGTKEERILSLADLVQSCEEEASKTADATSSTLSMYS